MTARNIQDLLPAIRNNCITKCTNLSRVIHQARRWDYDNLEATRELDQGGFHRHILQHSNEVEDELERLDSCIKELIGIKRILEDCDSEFENFVGIPSLQLLAASAIKDNPEYFKSLPKHFSSFSSLNPNSSDRRIRRKKTRKSA